MLLIGLLLATSRGGPHRARKSGGSVGEGLRQGTSRPDLLASANRNGTSARTPPRHGTVAGMTPGPLRRWVIGSWSAATVALATVGCPPPMTGRARTHADAAGGRSNGSAKATGLP
jgi:hypothetical protein